MVLQDATPQFGHASNGGTSIGVAITIASNSNRLLVALVGFSTATFTATLSGAGATWTQIGTLLTSGELEVWIGTGPTTGAQTVTSTFSSALGAADDSFLCVYSLYNAEQTTTAAKYFTSSSVSATLTFPCSSEDYVLTIACSSASQPNNAAGQNGVRDVTDAFQVFYSCFHARAVPSTVTMSAAPNFGQCGAIAMQKPLTTSADGGMETTNRDTVQRRPMVGAQGRYG